LTPIDPIAISTVWHGFQSLCREMRTMVTRTADGSTVAVPEGLPGQFLNTQFAITDIREKFKDNLHPVDVILTNNPYHGGHNSHLPDRGFIQPIFFDGELVFFTMVRGHMQDTGGSFPGSYFPNAYDTPRTASTSCSSATAATP